MYTILMQHLSIRDMPERLWSRDIGSGSTGRKAILSQPVIKDGVLYAIDADAKISAIDAENGRVIWDTKYSIENETEMLAMEVVLLLAVMHCIFVTGYGHIGALNLADGSEIWLETIVFQCEAHPTYSEGRVFAITHDNHIYAMDAQSGDIIWDEVGIAEK
jgi:outer membrane protein assembly factor BamB